MKDAGLKDKNGASSRLAVARFSSSFLIMLRRYGHSKYRQSDEVLLQRSNNTAVMVGYSGLAKLLQKKRSEAFARSEESAASQAATTC